ncbi:MAG: ATP-dependent helicase, partial [Chloroflexi bacterium]|nr:ATP-dependent helicase [Chloroflexota bacterium]
MRRTTVDARVVPIAEALGWLAGLPADSDLPASLAAWSVAVKAALGLVARGRLLPTISPGGFDAWRVGPLDPADEEWLARLAAALPL